MGHDVDLREMAQISGKMAHLFDKHLKNVAIDLDILGNGQNLWEIFLNTWGTAIAFEKRLYYVRNGLRI